MNAQTPIALTEQDTLDRMARNRASDRRPSSRGPAEMPPIPPEAFRIMHFTDAVRAARDVLAVAECSRRAAMGRVAKEKLRPAVTRARMRLKEAEHALAAEMRGAEGADAVMRVNQVGPTVSARVRTGEMRDGKHVVRIEQCAVTLREAQVSVTDRGRIEQVTAVGRLIRDKSLTAAQGAALVRYQQAFEAAAAGLYGTGLNFDSLGSGSSTGGNARIEHAVADGLLLAQMRAALFPRGLSIVEHVAIQGLTISSWAARQVTGRERQMNPARAMGLLEAAADILVDIK